MKSNKHSDHPSMEKWQESLETDMNDFINAGGDLTGDKKRKFLFDNVGPD